ncbi:hypothetical protein N7494_002332 [Penicillium frequentans]|uniref:G-patch domain-containing protein n=1 Tax=Penicillium frequentans TaxID=3151616 RepID=A0AAD6GIN6_9EURO|nr:hypothetical protein N7494_002332 [Penicillium glabrum]
MAPSEDEEDDYMSMVIEEPTQKESFTQRKRREQREAEARGRVPSKAERAAQEAARRDEALAKSTLDPSNKGFKMMAKLGFKPGDSLGKRDADTPSDGKIDPAQARAEPLNLTLKDGRGGIGKLREEAEEATKKIKREEGDYRDRVREERELRRTEAQVRAAQKVAERLDLDAETKTTDTKDGESHTDQGADEDEDHKPRPKRVKPTSQINVLYRGLVREYEEREREKQARHALETSLPSSFFRNPKLPGYDDEDLEREDKQAIGNQLGPYTAALEQEVEEEDPELDAFNALEPSERLEKLVRHLRDTYRYCFWCKYRYETDVELEGCPGLTEEDHD